ncbi:hypothetical protein BV898_19990, partial [Hypsibius exemplaris]
RNDWNDYHKEECRLLFRRPEYTQQRVGKVNTEFMKVDGKPVLTFIHVILAHKAILRLKKEGLESDFDKLPLDPAAIIPANKWPRGSPSTYSANEAIIRTLDSDGVVYPSDQIWRTILSRILQNQSVIGRALANPAPPAGNTNVGCYTIERLKQRAGPIDNASSCTYNAWSLPVPGSGPASKTEIAALRDIYDSCEKGTDI